MPQPHSRIRILFFRLFVVVFLSFSFTTNVNAFSFSSLVANPINTVSDSLRSIYDQYLIDPLSEVFLVVLPKENEYTVQPVTIKKKKTTTPTTTPEPTTTRRNTPSPITYVTNTYPTTPPSIDTSDFISQNQFDKQLEAIFNSIGSGVDSVNDNVGYDINTITLTTTGNATIGGTLSVTGTSTFTGDITLTGTINGSLVGGVNPGFTTGSVIFQGASGLTQDNASFFWDDTNNRLGLGDITPSTTLDVTGTGNFTGALTALSFNGNTFTTGTGTLTLAAGKTLTASNTLTLAGTDGSTLNVGTGGNTGDECVYKHCVSSFSWRNVDRQSTLY